MEYDLTSYCSFETGAEEREDEGGRPDRTRTKRYTNDKRKQGQRLKFMNQNDKKTRRKINQLREWMKERRARYPALASAQNK